MKITVMLDPGRYTDELAVVFARGAETCVIEVGVRPVRRKVGVAACFAHELGHIATLPQDFDTRYTALYSAQKRWECAAWAWAMQKYGADPVMRRSIHKEARLCLVTYGVSRKGVEAAIRWRDSYKKRPRGRKAT